MTRKAILPVALLAAACPLAAQGKIYFVGNSPGGPNSVRRADLDGSNVEVVVPGLTSPTDVVVDPSGGKVYWTDNTLIQRANLDGTAVETVVSTSGPKRGLAIDPGGDRLYWTEASGQRIQRSSLSGTGIEDLVAGLDFPTNLALDLAGGKMYWSEQNALTISRADLDGGNLEVLHSGNGSWGLALDPVDQKLYWATSVSSTIFRSDLDGSNREIVHLNVGSDVTGMGIDPVVGKLYWVGTGPSRMQRMNFDGSGLETVVPFLNTPLGVDLDLSACPPPAVASITEYGCGVNPHGSIDLLQGPPKLGRDLILGVDNPLGTQPAGSLSLLILAAAPNPAFPCGTSLAGFGMASPSAPGELLVRPPWTPVFGPAWQGAGNPAPFTLPIPALCLFSGVDLYAQGAIFDPAATTGIDLALGEAVKITFGR